MKHFTKRYSAYLLAFGFIVVALMAISVLTYPYSFYKVTREYQQHLVNNEKGFYTLKPQASFELQGVLFESTEVGFRKTYEQQPDGSQNIGVVGSWMVAGLAVRDYQSVASRLNSLYKERAALLKDREGRPLFFSDFTIGGNDSTQTVQLIREVGSLGMAKKVIWYLSDYDFLPLRNQQSPSMIARAFWPLQSEQSISEYQRISLSEIYENAVWDRFRASLMHAGQLALTEGIQVIPVILPSLSLPEDEGKELMQAMKKMVLQYGFFPCEVERPTFIDLYKGFLGSDGFSQVVAAQTLTCLSAYPEYL